jgi:hypothetical protein
MPTAPRPRKLIVSASRRQDIPACAPGRLLEQIRARELVWKQPYSGKPVRLRFEPEEIFCLALWSKNFGPLLCADAFGLIDPLHPYFIFTINDCRALEPGLAPSLEERLAQAKRIVQRYGAPRLLWRFDPIVHWIDSKGRPQHNYAAFERIARQLAKLSIRRCTFSFAQLYGKVLQRERRLGLRFIDPPLEQKKEILAGLAGVAANLGIQMLGCCQPELAGCHENVRAAGCIDGPYLCTVIDADPTGLDLRAHPSREGCGCTRSTDVGSYERCAHQCAYCYANP